MKVYSNIIAFFKNTWFTGRFFGAFAVVILLLAVSFVWPFLFWFGVVLAGVIILVTFFDLILLYQKSEPFHALRKTQRVLSNGDENSIKITLRNDTELNLSVEIYDELPVQLQSRDFYFGDNITPSTIKEFTYTIRPTERGAYLFGNINIFLSSIIGLVQRRQIVNAEAEIAVYPSIIQMKKFELRSLEKASHFYGIKKMRRIGQSYEFEQIKEYVRGDDFRKINWKATGKANALMINQYVEERAQMVYCFIDKGRSMKLPFYGLSLFDYAINTSLVLANVSLQKQDKAGFVSFSNHIDSWVSAGNKSGQLRKILETLYNQRENFVESNYELLYNYTRKNITQRSLIFLFCNFETMYSLQRQINVLRKLNKLHLLVVIFFENTEISSYLKSEALSLPEIYEHTTAEKFLFEKLQVIDELRKYGIQTIYTKPEELTVNSVNKYLEIKARGLI